EARRRGRDEVGVLRVGHIGPKAVVVVWAGIEVVGVRDVDVERLVVRGLRLVQVVHAGWRRVRLDVRPAPGLVVGVRVLVGAEVRRLLRRVVAVPGADLREELGQVAGRDDLLAGRAGQDAGGEGGDRAGDERVVAHLGRGVHRAQQAGLGQGGQVQVGPEG